MNWGDVGIFVCGFAVGLVFWGVVAGRFIGQVRLVTAAMNNQIKAIDEREARREARRRKKPAETMTEFVDELKAKRGES